MALSLSSHFFYGNSTDSNLNELSGDDRLSELVEDDVKLLFQLLTVLGGVIHSVTAREGLGGVVLPNAVVQSSSKLVLVEVAEELVLVLIIVVVDVLGVVNQVLTGGDAEGGKVEDVHVNELVEDDVDFIVVLLGNTLGGRGNLAVAEDTTGVGRAENLVVITRALLKSLEN